MATAFTGLQRKLFKIFKSFLMKKLSFIIGCMSIAVTISSCTTDNIEDTTKEKSNKLNKISVSTTTEILPGVDDKDKTKT